MGEKRGQVTIFIIIAVVVVALAAMVYFLRSGIITTTGFDEKNPQRFIQSCLEDKLEQTAETIGLQGGSINPEHYVSYQSTNIEYLCYSSEYYKTCVVQQPLLKAHIESEIKTAITPDLQNCFSELKSTYESKGYTVAMTPGDILVELLPKRVVTRANYVVTVRKNDEVRYDEFSVILNNNLYELSSIAESIVEWESSYGDAETTVYMGYYKDLKVEKKLQQDGTAIYILTDRNTENKFQFASRSAAWPPGYGLSGVTA